MWIALIELLLTILLKILPLLTAHGTNLSPDEKQLLGKARRLARDFVDTCDSLGVPQFANAPVGSEDYQPPKPSERSLQVAARVWCDQEMGNVVMDSEAAEVIARLIDGLLVQQTASKVEL